MRGSWWWWWTGGAGYDDFLLSEINALWDRFLKLTRVLPARHCLENVIILLSYYFLPVAVNEASLDNVPKEVRFRLYWPHNMCVLCHTYLNIIIIGIIKHKGHKSLRVLFGSVLQQCGGRTEVVSQWQGNIQSCLGTGKNKYMITQGKQKPCGLVRHEVFSPCFPNQVSASPMIKSCVHQNHHCCLVASMSVIFNPTTRILQDQSFCSFSVTLRGPPSVSETESGIIDPLVSKRPKKNLKMSK